MAAVAGAAQRERSPLPTRQETAQLLLDAGRLERPDQAGAVRDPDHVPVGDDAGHPERDSQDGVGGLPPHADLEALLRPVGFFRVKARTIRAAS